ncbi:MAG: 50S ribosomal protein L9 [Planctomycetes bacterium]|nr:50S ribosomal protein L9 [Planctomycetota bacterium]
MPTSLEVLLRRSVESLGRVGEVVKVRTGYARNYLFPHGIAVLPTKENLRLVEKDKAVEAALEAERAKQRAELVAKLAGTSVSIEVKSNPEGHLFGSVTAKQVAELLVAKGFAVEERHVRLEPVKQLGEYEVPVHLAADAEVKVKLWVLDEVTKQATKAPAEEPKPEPAPEKGAKGGRSAKAPKA